jgi:hypothetical protein
MTEQNPLFISEGPGSRWLFPSYVLQEGGVMMKGFFRLIFGGLLLFGITISSVSALDFTAYPDSLKKGNFIINAGIGFGTPLYGDMTIPPISVSVDYALPIGGLPFTVGALGGFNMSQYKAVGYKWTYTGIAIAGRMGYHPDFGVKNLDPYVDIALGYYIYTGKSDLSGGLTPTSYSTFYWGGNLGARYFFIPNLGAFLELGYSALSYVTAGVAIKF